MCCWLRSNLSATKMILAVDAVADFQHKEKQHSGLRNPVQQPLELHRTDDMNPKLGLKSAS